MNVTFTETAPNQGRLSVSITEEDYAKKVDDELRKIGKTHTIPGFRKGHVSLAQLRQRFGKQVKSDVLNHEVYSAATDYIKENKLQVLGQPMPVEVKEINLDDKDYTFEYEVGLAPEINVKLDKEVNFPYYTIKVTDEMIADQDKSFRERFGEQVPGEEIDRKAIVKGSIFELNADGSVKEGEDAIQVVNGIVAPFYFKDRAEEDKFVGKHLGDKVVFNPYASCEGNVAELASMLNIDKEKAAEVKSNFEMTISEIIVVKLAEHNQEFFDNVFGADRVHNEEEYTAAVRDLIARGFRSNTDFYSNVELRKYLEEKYGDMELPAEFLKRWLASVNPEVKDAEGGVEKAYTDALPSLKWQIIKDRVAEALHMELTNEDVMARAKYIARQQFQQYGIFNMDEETITDTAKRILQDNNYRQRIVEEVSDLKLFHLIREAITLDNKEVSIDEFKEMVNSHPDLKAE